MKKFLSLFFIILELIFAFHFLAARHLYAYGEEKIDSFDSTISINFDASISVSEKIDYDFGSNGKHGIFRNIPVKYRARGGNYNLRVSDIGVTDENGSRYKFIKYFSGGDMVIKIGDANKLVSGKKTYVINYRIRRAINYFDSHDELYWNAVGGGWQVRINNIKATIIFPESVKESELEKECFVGKLGSTDSCEDTGYVYESGNSVRQIEFSGGQLNPGEGLAVVVGFPKGIAAVPSVIGFLADTLKDNAVLFIPFLSFVILFWLWWTRGRDPEGRGVIIPQYDVPDNLTPGEAGTIIDEKADDKDVSANIINLAIKGHIKINRIENEGIISKSADYLLEKLKDDDAGLEKFDQLIMKGLFAPFQKSVKLSRLKNDFYTDLKHIKKEMYQSVLLKGYFVRNPNEVRASYVAVGLFIIFFIMIFLNTIMTATGALGVFSFLMSAILVIFFGFIMPARTRKGVETKEYILGLKEYLTVAEKDRIEFHNAPEKNPEHFEKLLPYAMVLGVEKEWAKQFEGIYDGSPSWYGDKTGARFNSVFLAVSLGDFYSFLNGNLSQGVLSGISAAGGASGFGGGGFSGGGFGGGGGGSW